MREILTRYTVCIAKPRLVFSIFLSIFVFAASVVYNFYTNVYATLHASNYVEDIILSNIPVFDVGWFFVWGAIALTAFVVLLCLSHPKRIPFILYGLSLFYFIRGTFVALTHLAPYPTQTPVDATDLGTLIAKQFTGSDLFFSAHTGVPFLLALIFWDSKPLRYIFLSWSCFFAVVVLLGHLHYSIDVLSAFFITYTIYNLLCWFFPKEHHLFHTSNTGA
jgi:hypothetical protein